MTNLQQMGRCFDAIQHTAELIRKQPARRRHDLAAEILKELRNAKWYVSLYIQEIENASHDNGPAQRALEGRTSR